jgi:hypothetical protein
MKTIKHITMAWLLTVAVLGLTLSSCQKSFDPKSYAPKKPLPSFGGFNSSKEIEPSSLIGYWAFDGTLLDSVSNSAGVATGTSFGTGVVGKGLQGAANSYALCDAPTAMAGLQSYTVSVWVNTPPPSNGIIGFFSFANTTQFWGNLDMFFENGSDNTNGKVRVHMSQNGADNTYSIDGVQNLFNAWVNIMVSYDQTDGTCKLYVNGDLKNTGAAGSLTGPLAFTNVGKIIFGCVQFQTNPSQTSATGSQPWASYLTGNMDQVRVYNKVLSATEASALYNLEKLGR